MGSGDSGRGRSGGPSRRRVLGAAAATAASGGGARAYAVDGRAPAPPQDDPLRAAGEAIARLLPDHRAQFALRLLDEGPERFEVGGRAGRVELAGTSPATLLTGLHWYLKYACSAQISWAGSHTEHLPRTLPAPARRMERRATVPHRFALNDTHDGYTAPYADWAHWERLIDVLALHGCNEVLVTVGAEAVYHRLLRDFGYGDEEIRSWIPAPTHQPWWLMQNMSGYGGPVSPQLLERRTALGQRVVRRLRELGMEPVLPGWYGTVPDTFAERVSGARTVPQGDWNGLPRPAWLDPRCPAFARAAKSYYRHQAELFGPVRRVKMDLLHEGGKAGDVPVPEAARRVEAALQEALPGALWLILGWQRNPRPDLLKGIQHRDRMLIVDGLSDTGSVSDRDKDWGGVPYAFGSIPNFGGRTTLGARTHVWAERFARWRDKEGGALAGTAYMPEATHRDPAAFELFSELAWRDDPVDREAWFAGYARLRYGGEDEGARRATRALCSTAYAITSADGRPHDSVFAARPDLSARAGTQYATKEPAYDVAGFDAVLDGLLEVREPLRRGDGYRYDVTDAARQALADRSWPLIVQLQAAYRRRDRETFRALAGLWLRLMRLGEEVTGGHRAFLLGPWLEAARRAGAGAEERGRLERGARALITTWAGRSAADGGKLANYANRDWHGLIGEVHLPQWRRYLEELEDALAEGRSPRGFDWYGEEERWVRGRGEYPLRPVVDPYRAASRVRDVLARAAYQGWVRLSSADGELRAEFRNLNGFRATGRVDFALSGLEAEPRGVSAPRVEPGGSFTARWRVRASGPQPYEVRVTYGPSGERPVTVPYPGKWP